MLNMKTFYEQLMSANDSSTSVMRSLAQLTRMSLKEIVTIESNLTWSVWG